MAYISLIFLAIVVFLAVKFGKNPGILGVCASFILGFLVLNDKGVAVSSIAGGCKLIMGAFPTTMFLRIMFSAMLFSILGSNGTLQFLTDRVLMLAKGNQKLFPVIFFFLNLALSFAGVNTFTQLVIMTPIACSIAHRCKQHPLLLLMSTAIGARAAYTSPLNVLGIAMYATADAQGFGFDGTQQIRMTIVSFVSFAVYYIALKAYKLPRVEMEVNKDEHLNSQQWISLIAVITCIVLSILGFELSIMSGAFTAVLVLVLNLDEKKIISSVPWSTIITICGMSMLVSMIQKAGGIDLLISFFQSFMTKSTCVPFFIIIAALLSSVSSATGVVIPTLYPTLPAISATYGVAPGVLGLAIAIGATATGIMPMSTVGATFLGLSAPEDNENNYLFNMLMLSALILVVVAIILSFFGVIG